MFYGFVLRRSVVFVCLACLTLTGCLPSGCQREVNRAISPADSLSRDIAQTAPVDTLTRVWSVTGEDIEGLTFPRTVRFVPSDSNTDANTDPALRSDVVVTDAEGNRLFRFEPDGTLRREMADAGFDVPYLAGLRGDTLIVFNAGTDRFDAVVNGTRVPDASATFDRPDARTLAYTLATDAGLYAKVVGQTVEGTLLRMDRQGRVQARTTLPGASWRHAGSLRAWGDTLVSLSGFRPSVTLLPLEFADDAQGDSTRWVGFDSPMLERAYAFRQGDVDQAPLLSTAAAPAGDRLYVLNLRNGWVRVDVFGRDGRIQRVLTEGRQSPRPNFYPVDLDVHEGRDALYLVVALRQPVPRVDVYRVPTSDSL